LRASARIPSVIVGVVIAAVAGLSTWYLVRPQPLLFQNEVDATPFHNLSLCESRCARARNHAMRLLNSRSGTRRLDLYRGLTASAK
jgi:hypothetical protein